MILAFENRDSADDAVFGIWNFPILEFSKYEHPFREIKRASEGITAKTDYSPSHTQSSSLARVPDKL